MLVSLCRCGLRLARQKNRVGAREDRAWESAGVEGGLDVRYEMRGDGHI
jgi:hypothetical protein